MVFVSIVEWCSYLHLFSHVGQTYYSPTILLQFKIWADPYLTYGMQLKVGSTFQLIMPLVDDPWGFDLSSDADLFDCNAFC
jgi:hypothetical protein